MDVRSALAAHGQRTVSRRKQDSQARVRSTTQRQRPNVSRDSMPRRAMRGVIPRVRQAARRGGKWSPLSACRVAGRRRGRP